MPFHIEELGRDRLEAVRRLLEAACPDYQAGQVLDEKLFEPGSAPPASWIARRGLELFGVATGAGRYVRLLAVDPDRRGVGVGSALLERCEELARAAGEVSLTALAEPGNYLAPGIDAGDSATLGWLRRRGFAPTGEAVNLLIDLEHNPRVTRSRLAAATERAAAAGYRIERARRNDAAALLAAIEREHPVAWAVEVRRALDDPPGGVFVARCEAGDIAAFAAHDGNNRGLGHFGPAATFPEHRGRGLGAALLLACLLEVADAGHPRCTVSWIGPRAFYERVASVAGERRYIQMTKELR